MRALDSFPFPDAGQARAGPAHMRILFRRLRLDWLLHRFPPRIVRSLYVFVNGFITTGGLALLALVSRNPFVFPALRPATYGSWILFRQAPDQHANLFGDLP
jgi:hypothetical protein